MELSRSPQMAMFTHHCYNYASPNELTTQASRVYTPLLLLRSSKRNDHTTWPCLHNTIITTLVQRKWAHKLAVFIHNYY